MTKSEVLEGLDRISGQTKMPVTASMVVELLKEKGVISEPPKERRYGLDQSHYLLLGELGEIYEMMSMHKDYEAMEKFGRLMMDCARETT